MNSKIILEKRVGLNSKCNVESRKICFFVKDVLDFVQICTKTNGLDCNYKNDHSVIGTFNFPLSNHYTMNVVDLCPIGALTSKDFRFKQKEWF